MNNTTVFKVSRMTQASILKSAIVNTLKETGELRLMSIGSEACYIAVKSIIKSKAALFEFGISMSVDMIYNDVEIDEPEQLDKPVKTAVSWHIKSSKNTN